MSRKERNVLARIERQSNTLPPAKSLASRKEFQELLDKCLTMQSPLIVLGNKIKTAITQLKDQ